MPTPTWTDPASFVANTMLTAAQLNTNVVDNLKALKAPVSTIRHGDQSGGYTGTANVWASVDSDLEILNFQTYGSQVMIGMHGTIAVPTGVSAYMDVELDGTRIGLVGASAGGLIYVSNTASTTMTFPVSFTTLSGTLSAGTHNFKLFWKPGSTGVTLNNTVNFVPTFWVQEVS